MCHDLALAMAKEIGAGMILMSELNHNATKDRKDWWSDADVNTAIKITDRSIAVSKYGKAPRTVKTLFGRDENIRDA